MSALQSEKWAKPQEIGEPAPEFEAEAFVDGEIKDLKLADYKGKWIVLFFWPFDFTFVCPTEVIAFNNLLAEFKKVNCEVIGCSVDSAAVHRQWVTTQRENGGVGQIDYPLLADVSHEISAAYKVLIQSGKNKGAAFRGTFIIDDKGILRYAQVADLGVGREPEELLRFVQGFQFVAEHGEVCPAKWKPGAKTFKPNLADETFKEVLQGK